MKKSILALFFAMSPNSNACGSQWTSQLPFSHLVLRLKKLNLPIETLEEIFLGFFLKAFQQKFMVKGWSL